MRKPGVNEVGGRSLLRSDVVRNVDARAGICFRKCRCGSQAAPYEIISILRGAGEGRGEGEKARGGEVKRGRRRKASYGERVGKIAARLQELLEKLIIFPVF